MKTPTLAILLVAAALGFSAGCESSNHDDGSDFSVAPADQVVSKPGQTVTLKASGSSGYVWSLERPDLGKLSATRGDTVVYTALVIPDNPAEQEVRVVDARGEDEDVDILHRR